MDVKTINPLLDAFANVLPQIGFQTVVKKAVSLANSVVNSGVIINIGVTGPLNGVIMIDMASDAAKLFASKMMMGMEVPELTDLAQSALSEMGNMVCANACTQYSLAGISGLDISPPLLLVGKDGRVRLPVTKALVVDLLVDEIAVRVYVGLR
ncbi:chemotaxis protein CheX [Anaeroselena agilis]|uniref:Chemotaxis protein CheX n=1 Tax=Anaeroselena agilis TaxID=3063788 RepID=A0ABU3NT46_9FIRM|nr:chemotaxis protein CheX [Selenomonadales bacterium 4137-cl]